MQAFTIRLPADLYLKVVDRAAAECRNLRAQIQHDLTKIYKD